MNPKFSILCTSFNHERYVADFINSVLNQTYQDFELVIVDDCSSDKNVEIIKSFNDARIKFIQHEYNKGINAGLNTAFSNSSGDYIALIASDDMLKPDYLEKVLDTFENNNVIAVYCNLNVIDENNKLRDDFEDSSLPFVSNKSREDFLHNAFLEFNPLYSPGLSIKREYMEKLCPLPLGNVMYQDYRMNVQLLLEDNIKVLPDKLVDYRIERENRSSICGVNLSYSRDNLEVDSLMDLFLNISDIEFLKRIFEKEIEQTKIIPYEETIKYFLGRMALLSSVQARKIWGYHQVMNTYSQNADLLYKIYGFQFKDYLNLTKYFQTATSKHPIKKELKWYKKILSVRNTSDKKHKILYLFGIKIKWKR